jgi:hypothetical protein
MKPLHRISLCAALAVALVPAGAIAQAAADWEAPTMPVPGVVVAGSAPIEQALARIIPGPYRIELDKAVPTSAVLVWSGGSNWMDVLRNAVAPMGLLVSADWQTNTVRILQRPARVMPRRPTMSDQAFATAVPRDVQPTTQGAPPPPFRPVASVASTMTARPAVEASDAPVKSLPPVAKPARDALASLPVAMPATAPGASYVIPAGKRLSEGLDDYAKTFGWKLRWQLGRDYVLDAPLPIPAMSLQAGLEYVLRAYQAQGGLMGASFVLAEPNHVAVARPATALEH